MTTFTVSTDSIYGFIVHESARAQSFAMVPEDFQWNFDSKVAALAQASKLTGFVASRPGSVRTRMIETPDRFEAVADTRYGCAW
jgi:hypothetical protein